ncbi:hypothetical protein [Clostridium sp. JS66]|uniref:hypothetical protein n=1 Tax=Clostridium sp. JS66 TaxID=3064705 RepID=UPI00298DBEB3|nr:hypothetical protein [Clostridium sp. JS66]WPC42373.1 hypothetical protein Q6H37_02610 [Clostridium sp. JS66]
MEFVTLEDVMKEIELYKKEALKSCGDIKVNAEADKILKKHFEKVVKSLADLWFDELRHRIESKTNLYVDIKPFSKKSRDNENEFENILERDNIELIKIINVDKVLNKPAGLSDTLN